MVFERRSEPATRSSRNRFRPHSRANSVQPFPVVDGTRGRSKQRRCQPKCGFSKTRFRLI